MINNITNWIIENKEWVFSGIGITAYAALNVRADRAPWCIPTAQMVQRSR